MSATRSIPLTKGFFATVDAKDYERLMKYEWHLCAPSNQTTLYARRSERRNGRSVSIYMHRDVVNAKKGEIVDHWDGWGLNNTRENLRVCTRGKNRANAAKRMKSSSPFKGVHWDNRRRRWIAKININGKQRRLGRYVLEEDAATVYNVAAQLIYGEFAKLNPV